MKTVLRLARAVLAVSVALNAIEINGRAGVGEIEVSEKEWAKACKLRERYWLYVVFNCAGAHPELHRIPDPSGSSSRGPRAAWCRMARAFCS